MVVDLSVEVAGVKFKNPIIVSSCPLTRDHKTIKRMADVGVAGAVTKTLNLVPAVNPKPAVARVDDLILINAEKWADLPYEQWLEKEIKIAKSYGIKIIASVGLSVKDVEKIVPLVKDSGADMIELVSYDSSQILPMLEVARKKTDLPISIKVSANWRDEVFKVVEKAEKIGADAVTAIDSVGPVLEINPETGKPYLGSPTGEGWLSGRAIRPFALRTVAGIAQRVKIPIFGVGGISNGLDIVKMVMAGASAVQLCTIVLQKGHKVIPQMLDELEKYMERKNYSTLNDFRGITLKHIDLIGGFGH
ncbi:MAG: dihydroorotate dehydrogenase [Candidatus Asgardarchaeia archaeon]